MTPARTRWPGLGSGRRRGLTVLTGGMACARHARQGETMRTKAGPAAEGLAGLVVAARPAPGGLQATPAHRLPAGPPFRPSPLAVTVVRREAELAAVDDLLAAACGNPARPTLE